MSILLEPIHSMTRRSSRTPIRSLGEVIEFRNEIIHPKSRPQGIVTFVGLEHVERDTGVRIGSEQIHLEDMTGRRARFQAGDIVYGYLRPYLNKVWTAEFDGICSVDQYVFKVGPEADRNYVAHFLRSSEFLRTAPIDAAPGQLPRIRSGEIAETEIPLPPIGEQRRIAAILDHADGLRRKRREALVLLQELWSAVFIDFFGGLRIRDWSWPIVAVQQAGQVQLGRQRAPRYQTGRHTTPYVRVANVFENYISTDDVLSMDFNESDFEQYKLNEGDILLNEGQSTELVGRPAMWRSEIPNCCFQNTLIRFKANKQIVDSAFALAVFPVYFRSGEFSKISSKTSSVAHLGSARFAAMPFPLPPLDLQQAFAARVAEIDTLKVHHRAHLAKLDALFASLQHRAFRGEL
ncbi:type I restriction enzyme, S subunit [Rhizobiales bacterium GAS113]|nr:type I restriction enzyme, S subunit [Rhizobiales bacterium GAS113]